jgi:hypothetical protein
MSSRELIVRYLRERTRPSVFVPLALVIAALAGWAGRTANGFGRASMTALLWMLAFRVWDDIEDRARDAREHPTRVTVVADSLGPLIVLGLVFAAGGALLIALGAGPRIASRLGAVLLIAAVLGAWYRLRPANARGVVNGHVVLLKYPALAYAVSTVAPPFAALAALYLVLCVYEIVDDPALRGSIVARRIAISECALVSVIIATATLLGGRFL